MTLSISYDISSNRLRKKVSDYLIYAGLIRMQRSVFLGNISRYEMKNIRSRLAELLSKNVSRDDKIILNEIHKNSIKNDNFMGDYGMDIIKELRGEIKVKIY
ncbi:MAG: CRISPR-associated endonuclease Cas2 [Saprospiraceae bacterium]